MAEAIDPLQLKLAKLMGDDELFAATVKPAVAPPPAQETQFQGNPFEDILSKAVDALQGVSRTEANANQLISNYVAGRADLQDVMVATSKMNLTIQFAVTIVTQAVTTFKEITQMQV